MRIWNTLKPGVRLEGGEFLRPLIELSNAARCLMPDIQFFLYYYIREKLIGRSFIDKKKVKCARINWVLFLQPASRPSGNLWPPRPLTFQDKSTANPSLIWLGVGRKLSGPIYHLFVLRTSSQSEYNRWLLSLTPPIIRDPPFIAG